MPSRKKVKEGFQSWPKRAQRCIPPSSAALGLIDDTCSQSWQFYCQDCAFKPTPAANPIPAAPFLAGAVPTASVETLAAPTAAITSSPQACANGLTYLNDLTIPDGSEIQPGATIDKRWEVQNSGTCNWDETYALQLIAGDAMEAGTTRALIPARSGATISLRILFRAPETPGDYRTAWQAYSPEGEAFGDPVYMEIRVSEP